GNDVIELDELAFLAAMALLAHERALATVTLPDRVLHVSRNVPRIGRRILPGPVLRAGAELLLLELFDREIQRSIQDGGEIPVWELVAQERPGMMELVESFLADADTKVVAPARDRRHFGRATPRLNWPRGQSNGGFLDTLERALSDLLFPCQR